MISRKSIAPWLCVLTVVGGTAAHAQVAPPAAPPFAAAPPSAPADAGQFLTQSPNGGGTLVSQVRNMLIADKASLPAIVALAARANPEQQASIADALSQAAKAYLKTDEIFATQIQQAVVSSGLPEFVKAYAALAGDSGTGSTGGGGGGGGGAGSGGGGPTADTSAARGSSGAPTQFGTNATRNGTPNLLTGGTASGASFQSSSSNGSNGT